MVTEFKGWHMATLTVGGFAIIIAVNIVMAWQAISTFPGVEADSSYLASQDFDADKAAQLALGWTLTPDYDAGKGQIRLEFLDSAGRPVVLQDLTVLVGRPTDKTDDVTPAFTRDASGAYVATEALGTGKWMMHVTAHAQDGTKFYQRRDFHVQG